MWHTLRVREAKVASRGAPRRATRGAGRLRSARDATRRRERAARPRSRPSPQAAARWRGVDGGGAWSWACRKELREVWILPAEHDGDGLPAWRGGRALLGGGGARGGGGGSPRPGQA